MKKELMDWALNCPNKIAIEAMCIQREYNILASASDKLQEVIDILDSDEYSMLGDVQQNVLMPEMTLLRKKIKFLESISDNNLGSNEKVCDVVLTKISD